MNGDEERGKRSASFAGDEDVRKWFFTSADVLTELENEQSSGIDQLKRPPTKLERREQKKLRQSDRSGKSPSWPFYLVLAGLVVIVVAIGWSLSFRSTLNNANAQPTVQTANLPPNPHYNVSSFAKSVPTTIDLSMYTKEYRRKMYEQLKQEFEGSGK
jgi:hypothetical protein